MSILPSSIFQIKVMPLFPTLKLLALNAVVDNGLEMSPLLVASNPFHTKTILAVVKQPIFAPVKIALPRHVQVKSTAFELGVYFCLSPGIDVVCQLAEYNKEDNIISYGHTDKSVQAEACGYMVEVYYDSSLLRPREIVAEMFTLGFNTSIPQYAVSEYISVQYGYFTDDDTRQTEGECSEGDLSSIQSADYCVDMFPTPESPGSLPPNMVVEFEDRELEQYLNQIVDMDESVWQACDWGSLPAEAFQIGNSAMYPESEGWGEVEENLEEQLEVSTRTTILHKMTFLSTGEVLFSPSSRGLSQQCCELLYGVYNSDNIN